MVVRVRQAMIVPHSVQGGANGCKVASHLRSGRDLSLQSAASMDKLTGGVENGKRGGHEAVVGWQRAASESSLSSLDSLAAGEPVFSPSDIPSSVHHRKARLGLHASESDDEAMPDPIHEDFTSKKFRRPLVGGTVQPHPTASLNADEVVADHGSTPSDDGRDPSSRVKFMCSFGGKIFPRPSDGKLRYVGGDTKIIAVNRDTNFRELLAKMTDVYGQSLTLKYQLPDEDLDALVSVSSDEDLQNMMEEYDKLERADGSSRLRVFLFPAVDFDSVSHHKESAGDLRNSEQRYVDAVNGIPEAGSRTRVEAYVGNAPTFPIDNLIGLDVPEVWSLPRSQEAVPVVLAAPPIAHDVASHILRVPVGIPVSTISSRPSAPSAPSSAPSSPPLRPRSNIGKLPVVPDLLLQYHQDAHVKLTPQYNVLVPEGNYQENESYGGSGTSSAASQQQHEPLYRSSESRRGPDSPPRKQHEVGHQDHILRVEPRRLSEAKVPRVGSHGKLSRLAEHIDLAPSTSETQQLPDVLEMQRLLQQQQQSLHQGVWQHPKDPQQDNYRRPDLLQSNTTQSGVLGQQQQGYQQQHQPVLFRAGHPQGVPGHEAAYRQGDQQQQYKEEVLHHMPRSVSSHAMSSHTMTPVSGQSTAYHVGSAPSSPRLGFREAPSRHVQGSQQMPVHWAFGGPAFTEQSSFGRRKNYGDQSGRSFRLSSNSPPKYREHLVHADERLARQQQALGSSESLHHEQVPKSAQLLYETNPAAQPYDLLSRPQIPLYKGLNPFQEKLIPYQDHQEIGDGRRHQLPQQGKESQFLSGQQQHLHPLHQNQRLDYQDPLLQQAEQMSGNPRYQESLKATEWDSDEARLGFRARARTGQLDDELHIDSGAPHQREMQQASFSGLLLPETSDDLLSASVGDFTSVHGKNDRPDHSGGIGFQFRPEMLPPSSMGVYSNPKPRTNVPDSSGVPRYVPRSNEPDYLGPPGGLRAGGNGQDLRPPIFEVNGHQHTSAGVGHVLQLPSGSHRLEERPVPTAFHPIAHQLKSLRLGDNTSGGDIRWNGGLGPDDVRIEGPSQIRNLLGSFGSEDRLQGLPNLVMSSRGSRLSRPSSSTNIPSLIDEDRGDTAHLHAYGTQGRSSILVDEDITHQYAGQTISSTENVFTAKSSRYPNPSPPVNPAPATSTGLFVFDRTPPSSSAEYHIRTAVDDLPSIKTTSTQVPSVAGDESGGSTSTIGGSDQSLSERGSGDFFLGQLTMTQHLAEDMASCVLESSPIKVESDAQPEHIYDENLEAQGQSMWPEAAPAPDPWENVLDNAVVTKHEISDGKLGLEEGFVQGGGEVVETATSISKDEDSEDALIEKGDTVKNDSTVKNAADAAADEAIARGLQTIKNNDLEELRELGSGTFGTVYHGKWRGTDVAIKRIKASCFAGRPSEQERLIADFWREACNLGNLHHPNVVAFYGVVSDGPGGTLATVTEYMVNGSLKQVLQKKDRTIDRRKRLLIAMDSAFGMEYLHGKNIVHFDLKCENLLVNMRDPHRPICKVGDLGLSKVKHQTMVSGGVRGTLPWMAPELLNGSSSLVTEKVDVFSFGIVMWELLTGEEPYANMHYGAIIGGIVNNTLRPPIPTWCDPGWRSLMERCWSCEPASRPSFSEIASQLRAMSESLRPKAQPPVQGQQTSTQA